MKHHLHDRIPVIDLFAGPGGFVTVICRKAGKAFETVGGKITPEVGTKSASGPNTP